MQAGMKLVLVAGVVLLAIWITTRNQGNECHARGTSIVALTGPQVLYLCKDGEVEDWFYYSAGWNGFGKKVTGDRKTPVGTYSLSKPRPSSDFGIFIPVGYPNAEDLQRNYSGSDIGIYGPKRRFDILGWGNLAVNWTAGCLAVASDKNIGRIAQWLRDNPRGNVLHIVQK